MFLLMKHPILLISCLVAGSSMAIPLPIRVLDLKERLSSHHDVLPRALLKTPTNLPKKTPTQVSLKRMTPLRASARAKPSTRSSKISAGSNGSGNVPMAGGDSKNGASKNGAGDVGPPVEEGRYPPAEATARVNGPGQLVTNNHYREDAMFNKEYKSEDHPQGKITHGPVSAFAIAGSENGGGQVTAKGYHSVSVKVQNDWGTTSCIECNIPGQKPIRVEVPSIGPPLKMTVENANPVLGPIEVKAESDGPGVLGVTAKNHKI